jgi:hypothetical protein
VTPVTAFLNESADVLTPGYSVAPGRVGVQDAAVCWARRRVHSSCGNTTAFEHDTSVLPDIEKGVWSREVASRSAWFAQWVARTPRSYAVKRHLLSLCGGP